MEDLVLTRAEFARLMGFKQPYLNELIDKGTLSGAALLSDGRIVVKIAQAQIERHADPSKTKKGRPAVLAEADGDAKYTIERAERERIRKQLDQIELDRQLGTLCDMAAVREAGADLAEQVRQGLEQLVPALIQAVNGAKSAAMQDRAVRAVLERWRGEFATQVERRCRELTTDG